MTYRSILVHVEPGHAGEARIRCAADLADRFGAVLTGCASEMDPLLATDPLSRGHGQIVAAVADTVEQHLLEAKTAFEQIVGSQRHRWIAAHSLPDETLAQAAKGADILITGRPPERTVDPGRHHDPGMLVVISGRPVLIAPSGKDYLKAERVLVCFKDAREANRAVADALPLLERANEVLVVEVAPPKELAETQRRVDQVVAFLRVHGVQAFGEVLAQDARRTASLLQDRADCFGADLIVAGGYGRSRLGEWAFGGVTKSLLDQRDRFVLLSH